MRETNIKGALSVDGSVLAHQLEDALCWHRASAGHQLRFNAGDGITLLLRDRAAVRAPRHVNEEVSARIDRAMIGCASNQGSATACANDTHPAEQPMTTMELPCIDQERNPLPQVARRLLCRRPLLDKLDRSMSKDAAAILQEVLGDADALTCSGASTPARRLSSLSVMPVPARPA
jgi:hypothetical protein